MAKGTSVIEINGSRYDAVTGQFLGAVKRVAAQVKSPAVGAIDGLVRRPSSSIASAIRARNTTTRANSNHEAPKARRQAQRSQTLMRSGVSRPTADKKLANAVKLHKSRTSAINPQRVSRAKTIIKNIRVNHFSRLAGSPTSGKIRQSQTTRPVSAATRPVSTQALAAPLPSMITSVSHQHLERLLDRALLQADAHKQALRARTKGWRRVVGGPKWLSLGATSLVLLLLGGFFAWQNVPQVSLRVAAMRTHVGATVPAYTPSGFSPSGPASASSNKVTINYKAEANDQQTFAITQQSSNWDSSSVQANAVPVSSQVQTSQVNGTTVYIYGSSNDAKWVNHGVLFSLKDKANLSSDEILKIANSL